MEGKAKVAKNADKGGEWREMRKLRKFYNQQFKEQQDLLSDIQSARE